MEHTRSKPASSLLTKNLPFQALLTRGEGCPIGYRVALQPQLLLQQDSAICEIVRCILADLRPWHTFHLRTYRTRHIRRVVHDRIARRLRSIEPTNGNKIVRAFRKRWGLLPPKPQP